MVSKGAGFPPMRNKLRRYYGHWHLHFLTFSCYERRALLGSVRARNVFVRILAKVREKRSFLLVGYVVMGRASYGPILRSPARFPRGCRAECFPKPSAY